MPDIAADLLTTALRAAAAAGLRLTTRPGRPRRARLTCPACGGSLDVPTGETGPPPAAAARRVDAFAHRHRPGRVHQ